MKTGGYIEWYNENEGRAYPLSENATQISDDGTVLPTSILSDLVISVPHQYTGIRLGSLRITPNLLSLSISANEGGLLAGTWLLSAIAPYTAYPLTAAATGVSGWVVPGTYRTAAIEDYRFATSGQSGLEGKAIRYIDPPGVTSYLREGNNAMLAASGIVTLRAGSGIQIEKDPLDSHNVLIRLKPEYSDGLQGKCAQPATTQTCGVPLIRTFNGVRANQDGQITLRFV